MMGPGRDSSIKYEFGRMFSGLGSGVGSATPTPQQHANGTTTPSRLTPSRNMEGVDNARGDNEDGRGGSKSGRGGKKNRRPREEVERGEAEIFDGRMTPSLSQRGNKRSKTAHHHHHHAHHHHHHHAQHEHADAQQPTPFNTIRFPSNPLSHSNHTPYTPSPSSSWRSRASTTTPSPPSTSASASLQKTHDYDQ